jgi:hypothetical protein
MSEWQPIETTPDKPMPVIVFFAGREWTNMAGEPVTFGDVRDTAERAEIGFWDGESWCESGTGHDMFEPWRENVSDLPTHWMALPDAPGTDRETEAQNEA